MIDYYTSFDEVMNKTKMITNNYQEDIIEEEESF